MRSPGEEWPDFVREAIAQYPRTRKAIAEIEDMIRGCKHTLTTAHGDLRKMTDRQLRTLVFVLGTAQATTKGKVIEMPTTLYGIISAAIEDESIRGVSLRARDEDHARSLYDELCAAGGRGYGVFPATKDGMSWWTSSAWFNGDRLYVMVTTDHVRLPAEVDEMSAEASSP